MIIVFLIYLFNGLSSEWRLRFTYFDHISLLSVLIIFTLIIFLSWFIRLEQVHDISIRLWNRALLNLEKTFKMSAWMLIILFLQCFINFISHRFSLFKHLLSKLAIRIRSYSWCHWLIFMFFFLCVILKWVIVIGKTWLWKAFIIPQLFSKIFIFYFKPF